MHDRTQINERQQALAIGHQDLARSLIDLMSAHGSLVERIDPNTLRLWAVPVSDQFSKPRTNLLLRRMRFCTGCNVHVDCDLVYTGDEASLLSALAGPCHKNWRKLRLAPLHGSFNQVLTETLRLLGSPLAPAAATTLAGQAPSNADSRELGPILRSASQFLSDHQLAKAADATVRPALAEQLAKPLTRTAPPSCVVLCGNAGCGMDHLSRSAAYLLHRRGVVRRVLRVAASRFAAGHVFQPELDATLNLALAEAAQLQHTLIVVQDLDTALTHSPVCYATLVDALDQGMQMLATFRSSESASRVSADAALSRRLVMLRIDEPERHEVVTILQQYAAESPVPVHPAAIDTTMRLSDRAPHSNPAAAIGILSAAIAEAVWQNAKQVGPDEVIAGRDLNPFPDQQEE